jgi:N-acetylglutamate synthase-like GNAT family acetyltransferase
LPGYTDEDITKTAQNSFYSVYAYDDRTLVGLGRIASDGQTVAVLSGICVRSDYRRRGIGEGIVTRLVYYCQSEPYSITVQLVCEDSLIPWYEKFGFVSVENGMKKLPPDNGEVHGLRREFAEIYGIEQILEHYPDFYWYNFDAFGEFRYYGRINDRKENVACLLITFYIFDNNKKFAVEMIFENVVHFEIGCKGLSTPLQAFGIVKTNEDYRRYRICSLEDDDIRFYCESFRVINAQFT